MACIAIMHKIQDGVTIGEKLSLECDVVASYTRARTQEWLSFLGKFSKKYCTRPSSLLRILYHILIKKNSRPCFSQTTVEERTVGPLH